MSVVLLATKAFKRIFKSKLTWFLIILWTAFVIIFLFLDIRQHDLFGHWLPETLLLLMALFAGYGGIVFFRYNSYAYINQIDNQNQLLKQREKLLVKINERLTRQTDFLNLVTNSFSHPFFVIDANSYEIVMANKAFYEVHELPQDFELRKSKCYELSHHYTEPCCNKEHPCPLEEVKKTGKPATAQHIHKNSKGEERIVEVTVFPVFNQGTGEVKQVLEYNVDITDRIREQHALAEKEQSLRKIITTSPDGITVTDLNGIIKFASEKTADLLRFDDPSELIGLNVFDFLHKEEVGKAERAIKDLLENNLSHYTQEFKSARPDGSFFYQETNASILYDNESKPYRLILITRDITDRKITEERLIALNKELTTKTLALEELNQSLEGRIASELKKSREKDRLLTLQSRQAAMGEMIGNIAHQWRQPLNTISLIVFDLLEAFKYNEVDEAYLNNSYNEINRVVQSLSKTIDDFRNFFITTREKKVFEVNSIIDQSLNFTKDGLKSIDISLNFSKNGAIYILGLPNELTQTLINILQNAKDALIESKNPSKVIWMQALQEETKVLIRICNNGGNIPAENMEKLFDPYFTTKPEGQGMGMGLFISKTIIEKNLGGKLTVENTEDGVCFCIELQAYMQT